MNYVYIVAGAAVGAPLRYFLGSRVQSALGGGFPWGTLVVNLSGCLVIGLVLGLAEARGSLSREARLLLVTGFLGSYTTFSAFGWETYALLRDNQVLQASGNVALSVFAGLAGVWLGVSAAKAL